MANGDDIAQLSSLMENTAGPDFVEEELELDIEVAAPALLSVKSTKCCLTV